jgi:hypothetical protein
VPALHLRLTGHMDHPGRAAVSRDAVQRPTPAQAIAHLRSQEILLAYDPAAKALTADTPRAERITIS